MTIYYLYVKTHRITGLKYLGQTKKDPIKYKGSGLDWLTHIKQHGYDVDTEVLLTTDNKQERNDWGRYYSKLWNIVDGQDDYGNKIWANRIPETGGSWVEGVRQSPEHIAKRVAKNTGKKRPSEFGENRKGEKNAFYKQKHKKETKLKMKENHADVSGSKNPMFGKTSPLKGVTLKKTTCLHCGRAISDRNFSKWHGINCKSYFLS